MMKPIKTKSEEKYYSGRFLSREMSVTNSSSEVYYGDTSVTIPFRWESQPGTPKIKFPERPLPPLTPPPSYLCSPAKKFGKSHSRPSSNNILHTVFPKLNPRKCQLNNLSSPVSSSLSWSPSSSSSSSSSLSSLSCRQEKIARGRLTFDSSAEEESNYKSPVSTLCFFGTFRSSNARSRGGCSAKVIKLLLGESV